MKRLLFIMLSMLLLTSCSSKSEVSDADSTVVENSDVDLSENKQEYQVAYFINDSEIINYYFQDMDSFVEDEVYYVNPTDFKEIYDINQNNEYVTFIYKDITLSISLDDSSKSTLKSGFKEMPVTLRGILRDDKVYLPMGEIFKVLHKVRSYIIDKNEYRINVYAYENSQFFGESNTDDCIDQFPEIDYITEANKHFLTLEERGISYAQNYIFPTDNGIKIITNIPDNTDGITYIDGDSKEIIATSKMSNEIIDYETNSEIFNLVMLPIVDGNENNDLSLTVNVFRNQDKLASTVRFDDQDPWKVNVTTVIKNIDEYNDAFEKGKTQIWNIIDDLCAYDAGNNIVNSKFIDETIMGDHNYYEVEISESEFPLYIGYSMNSLYFNKGDIHYDKQLSVATNDYFLFEISSLLFKGNHIINFSINDKWDIVSSRYNIGTSLDKKNDGLTHYSNQDVIFDCWFALGEMDYNIKQSQDGDFTYTFAWFKFMGDLVFTEFSNKNFWAYFYLYDQLWNTGVDERVVVICPPEPNIPSHPWLTSDSIFEADLHGTLRLWFGGSKFETELEAGWLINAFADEAYNMRYFNKEGNALPHYVIGYFNHIENNPELLRPIRDYALIRPEEIDNYGINIGYYMRWFRDDLGFAIIDMLAYMSSDGAVEDLLPVAKTMYEEVIMKGQSINNLDFKNALESNSSYNFDNFFEKYINGAEEFNMALSDYESLYRSAFSDYSDEKLKIINEDLDYFEIQGKSIQDSYVAILSEKIIERVEINDKEVPLSYPWGYKYNVAVPVSKGEYLIKVYLGDSIDENGLYSKDDINF